jgi:thymidylate kinase
MAELKSAYELAMERLKKKDDEARLAEAEILYQSKLRTIFDPAARAEHEEGYRRDRERLTSERDSKIEKIRQG